MTADRQDGPVVAATTDLVAWLGDATGASVQLACPGDGTEGSPVLCAWPLELRPDQEARGAGQPVPMRLVLRYLVCAYGAVDEANRLLDRLLVAATTEQRDVVLDPPSSQLWLAFGVKPRPALLFDVPVQVARPIPSVPLVRQPLHVHETVLRSLYGRVVGPGDVPLAGMRVEFAGTGHVTHTDSNGAFAFAAVPSGEPARLRLRGRGMSLLAEIEQPPDEPLVIHCDIEEV